MQTVKKCMTVLTASRLGLCLEKSAAVTPSLQVYTLSGYWKMTYNNKICLTNGIALDKNPFTLIFGTKSVNLNFAL